MNFYNFPKKNRSVIAQFVSFAAMGLVGTACHFACLILMVQGLNHDPISASAVGFCVGTLVNYWLNYHVTFRSRQSHARALPKFLTMAVTGLALNTTLMFYVTQSVDYLLSQMFVTAIGLFWNFIVSRCWAFKENLHGGS